MSEYISMNEMQKRLEKMEKVVSEHLGEHRRGQTLPLKYSGERFLRVTPSACPRDLGFEAALICLRAGSVVKRAWWSPGVTAVISNGVVVLRAAGVPDVEFKPTSDELLAEDWFVVP